MASPFAGNARENSESPWTELGPCRSTRLVSSSCSQMEMGPQLEGWSIPMDLAPNRHGERVEPFRNKKTSPCKNASTPGSEMSKTGRTEAELLVACISSPHAGLEDKQCSENRAARKRPGRGAAGSQPTRSPQRPVHQPRLSTGRLGCWVLSNILE